MTELAPSLLSADFSCLDRQLKEITDANIKWLHIDIMDGHFVPSISFGFPIIKTLRKAFKGVFDVHLMIDEPIRYVEEFANSGSDVITVHLEACVDVDETLKKIRDCGCKAGLSIKPSTPIEALIPHLEFADMILLMTVEPGFGGQKYIHSVTKKIENLHAYLKEHGYDIPIEVDGGICPETVSEAVKAGSEILVSGSSVFKGNITKNIEELKKLMEQSV